MEQNVAVLNKHVKNSRSLAIKKKLQKCYHIKNWRDHKSVATDV